MFQLIDDLLVCLLDYDFVFKILIIALKFVSLKILECLCVECVEHKLNHYLNVSNKTYMVVVVGTVTEHMCLIV